MHHVYILRSLPDPTQFYTGITDDIQERLRHHNNGESTHTAKYRPWELVVCVSFIDRQKAQAFERHLKSGSGRAFAAKHFR